MSRTGLEEKVFLVLVGVVLLLATVFGCRSCVVNTACVEKGYKESKILWNLKAYCIKRQDQTDIVVPLNELE